MHAVLPLASAAAAEEESSNFLVSPNVGLMIWTLVAFLITVFVLNKFAFPKIKEALDKRATAIEESVLLAEKSKAESEALLEEYRERLKEARAQADDIVLRARKNAEVYERESQDQAREK
ncbi:MAG: ATP synthase F0 subunit B, partial [Actinobacteria bacterium]|nr:ATP synthase F0 subunit B [Actinomycetota bacterium]